MYVKLDDSDNMTVQELIDCLMRMPENASVIICHDLVGNEHEVVSVEYNDRNNTVLIREVD